MSYIIKISDKAVSSLFKDPKIGDFILKCSGVAKGLSPGTYEKIIYNDDLFAIAHNSELKNSNECIYESHKKFVDVHIVIKGNECVSLLDLKKNALEAYDKNIENDYYLYKSPLIGANVILDESLVAVFLFDDVHKVGIKTDDFTRVSKVVLKIKKSIFDKEFNYV